MKALRQINKAYNSLTKGGQPYIYHFRITKALTAQNVPKAIDRLRTMREAKAPRIFALSVDIHSGSPVLTKTLRDALLQTAHDLKAPLYTFAEDCALESGFYLLSAGHKIFANPYALLGDVAYIWKDAKVDKLIKKYVKVSIIKSGKYKNMSNIFEETSSETSELMEKLVKTYHQDMVDGIFESRDMNFDRKGLKIDDVRKEVGDGKTFTAQEALDKGLIDGIMTFEEFQEKYYKEYKVEEFTIDKDDTVGYERISSAMGNWWKVFNSHEQVETSLESNSHSQIASQVELAQDMLNLMHSEGFMEKLRGFVKEEVIGDIYTSIRGRMSMTDIMEFLDQSEAEAKSLLGAKI